MNEPSPYDPPAMTSSPPHLAPGAAAPAAIRIFGVLHLVFAGLGILGAIWGVVALFLKPGFGMLPEDDPQMQMQLDLQARSGWVTWVTSAMSLALAAVMITAGIKLLRYRGDALKWSNLYAWSSIGVKIVSLGLTAAVLAPAMREAMKVRPGGSEGFIVGGVIAGAMIGTMVTFTYPVLTLILLNRRPVKDWLTNRPV